MDQMTVQYHHSFEWLVPGWVGNQYTIQCHLLFSFVAFFVWWHQLPEKYWDTDVFSLWNVTGLPIYYLSQLQHMVCNIKKPYLQLCQRASLRTRETGRLLCFSLNIHCSWFDLAFWVCFFLSNIIEWFGWKGP